MGGRDQATEPAAAVTKRRSYHIQFDIALPADDWAVNLACDDIYLDLKRQYGNEMKQLKISTTEGYFQVYSDPLLAAGGGGG
jgi:hypothetical protein